MKTKKLLAILLSALMVMSFCISASAAGDRTESVMLKKGVEDFSEGVFDADDGTYGTAGYFGTGSAPSNTPAADANTTLSIGNEEGRGNYAKVNTTTSSNGQYAARMIFQNTFAISETKAIGIECKFRLPSKMTNGTATSDSTNVSVWISDNIYGRNRSNVMQVKKYSGKWGFYLNNTNTLVQAIELDKWYGMRVEYITLNSQSLARYRVSIFDENGNFLAQAISSQSGRATRELGMISFGQNAAEAEFHVDDFYAYSFNASDFNFGSTIFREGFENYTTIDESTEKYSYGWDETNIANGRKRALSMVWGDIKAGATKRVNAVTDEGSTDKYFRVKSLEDNSGYVQFKIDSIPEITSMDAATTYYSDALVFGTKIRVDDTSKDNAIELWITTKEYTAADETSYVKSEQNLILIEPDLKAVRVGSVTTLGFDMSSDVWYDLKLYYNDVTGYCRLELTNTVTGKTEIFEGVYTDGETYDSKAVANWGFVTRFVQSNIVDYDNLTLTAWNPSAASMAKVYDASAITLSKEAIEAGEIKATVDITGYSQAKDITTEVANLVFVSYEGDRLSEIEFIGVKPNTYTAEATLTIPEEGAENYKVKAMLWGEDMSPIVESVALGSWE